MNTGKPKYDEGSREKLRVVDERLRKIFEMISMDPSTPKFRITCGTRSIAEQRAEFDKHASNCDGTERRSKHQDGLAVDVALFDDKGAYIAAWPPYARFAEIVKAEALFWKIPLVWGGDWPTMRDGPHFELA